MVPPIIWMWSRQGIVLARRRSNGGVKHTIADSNRSNTCMKRRRTSEALRRNVVQRQGDWRGGSWAHHPEVLPERFPAKGGVPQAAARDIHRSEVRQRNAQTAEGGGGAETGDSPLHDPPPPTRRTARQRIRSAAGHQGFGDRCTASSSSGDQPLELTGTDAVKPAALPARMGAAGSQHRQNR